jgi:hypothetical protein
MRSEALTVHPDGQRLVHVISLLSSSTVAQAGTSIENERRKEFRYNTDEAVTLQALNPLSTDRCHGHLTDVSRSGMKLRAGARVESGTLIKISLQHVIAFGEVRYCKKMGAVFHFGVKLSQVVQVSTPYRPI